jgi:hypothetical protein
MVRLLRKVVNTEPERGPGDKTQILVWTAAFALTGGMLLVSFVMAYSGPGDQSPQIGVGLALFLEYSASITVGAFLGFLFGLPRARVIDQVTAPQPEAGTGKRQQAPLPTQFLTNSNLLKVSDWLTTIIIGLTLVNLGEILSGTRELGNLLREPLGGFPHSAAVGVSVAIGSAIAGFILGYIWTSIRVRQLLEEAEAHAAQIFAPNLKGKTLDEAKSVSQLHLLELDFQPATQGTAIITDQYPKPGTKIAPGQVINLII